MRQVLIKEVNELTNNELELLLKDHHLQGDIMEYVYNMESYFVDDMFDYIKHYLSEYSIDPYSYSYMKVSNIIGFIGGVVKLNNDYNILDDDMLETLNLVTESSGINRSVDIGSDLYYSTIDSINLYINDIVEYLIKEFVSILEYYNSFDKVAMESDYIDLFLENIHGRDCLIDNGKVTLL